MSSDSEDYFFRSSASRNRILMLAAMTARRGWAPPADWPVADWLVFLRPSAPPRNRTGAIFRTHTCQGNLTIFLSINRNPTGNELRRRVATALAAYLTCLTTSSQEVHIMKRSLDILLSCNACLGELCLITAAKSEDLTEYVLCNPLVPPELCSVVFTSPLEAMLCRATAAADFPCVKLGLCRCAMRPLYVAIYFSNEQMMSTLLRYGADVAPEDTCGCVAPVRVHPLLRVYKMLSVAYWPLTGVPDRHVNSSASMDIVPLPPAGGTRDALSRRAVAGDLLRFRQGLHAP
ncbi:hypothetical protein HPB48_000234 [Haemaphysalis longicornis]|uniref:Ankyrin repeat protein n=1 Tax=Haemaphysalis longicornis TaxID=44386 RepID=A0A9J6GLW4_HAELO|nr:hypothetical protein HPB48_000234 [Haemaphysalis longicornis]